MFSVLFEVHPKSDQWDAYLGYAKLLRPELEQIDGFVDNVRYASLKRAGCILSLSGWRDEKSVVRWRTRASHHDIQLRGRTDVFADYHLRVGEVTSDSHVPAGHVIREQRLDETEVGEGTTIVLVDAKGVAARGGSDADDAGAHGSPEEIAKGLGLDAAAEGLVSWDVFDAVLSKGDVVLMMTWRDSPSARRFVAGIAGDVRGRARVREIRVVRDYGMFDRREAPQFYAAPANRPNG